MLSTMRSDLAFKLGELSRDNPKKVFDWHRAVELIKFHNIKEAYAGLEEDWAWTGGIILENGMPIKGDYTYLASTWATPVLVDENDKIYACWCWEDECIWDHNTQWPLSAVLMLMGEENE